MTERWAPAIDPSTEFSFSRMNSVCRFNKTTFSGLFYNCKDLGLDRPPHHETRVREGGRAVRRFRWGDVLKWAATNRVELSPIIQPPGAWEVRQDADRRLVAEMDNLRVYATQVERENDRLKRLLAATKEAPRQDLMTKVEVIHRAQPFRTGCGVYFLIKRQEIVYVGQSVNVLARVAGHVADGKDFDRVTWVAVAERELNAVEAAYIKRFQPVLNGENSKRMPTNGVALDPEFSLSVP